MKKIAHMTDLHLDDFLAQGTGIDSRKNCERALTLAQRRGVTQALLTGDLGEPESAGWLFESIRSRGMEFLVTLGNHDKPADFRRFDFLQPLIKDDGLYFSEKVDGLDCECLFLDSSAEEIGSAQLDWLTQQLARAQTPVILFIHHPILDCGNTIADRLFPLKNRDAVRQVLSESRREVTIFCGHYHFRNAIEVREKNLRQLLTPSIFGQIKQYGEEIEPETDGYIAYREIWMADGKLQTEIVQVHGTS